MHSHLSNFPSKGHFGKQNIFGGGGGGKMYATLYDVMCCCRPPASIYLATFLGGTKYVQVFFGRHTTDFPFRSKTDWKFMSAFSLSTSFFPSLSTFQRMGPLFFPSTLLDLVDTV
jgi:hypothetical protein